MGYQNNSFYMPKQLLLQANKKLLQFSDMLRITKTHVHPHRFLKNKFSKKALTTDYFLDLE